MLKVITKKRYNKDLKEASKFDYIDIIRFIDKDLRTINISLEKERYMIVQRIKKCVIDLIKHDRNMSKSFSDFLKTNTFKQVARDAIINYVNSKK